MKHFLRQVYEVYKPLKLSVLGMLGFIMVTQMINLISPYLYGRVIDGLIGSKFTDAYYFAALSAGIWIFRGTFFQYLRDRYELAHIDFAIPARMQEVTLKRMFQFSIGQHTSENSGIKQSVINRGQNALTNLGDMVLYQAIPLTTEILILTSFLLYKCAPIGFTILGCVSTYAIFVILLNKSFHKDMRKIEKLSISDSKFRGEVISNIGLVMANAQEEKAILECRDSLHTMQDFAAKTWKRFVLWAATRNAIPAITRFLVVVEGIYFISENRYTIGQFTMFMTWTTGALGNLGELSPMHRRLIQAYTSVKRYFDMLNIEPDVKVIANPVRPEKFEGKIEFKGVTFRYQRRDKKLDGDEAQEEVEEKPTITEVGPALDNVSFVINPGERVAFVGESGAGKSTLVNALIRAKDPDAGQIIIDGNDLRVIDLKSYRRAIGIVQQDVPLFDRTLRENITYGLDGDGSQIGDPELHAIAEMSCIDRFYGKLEKGFDTLIGERGVKLSGGERQRVGIARALIKEPDILIFDEATSSLDSGNEALIQESIERASVGRTTIIIAHRFSTIRNVDRIIVMENGRVVGNGTHQELSQNCEVYRKLVEKQVFA